MLLCLILSLIVMWTVIFFSSPVITINLVTANSDLSRGPEAWEFKVDGKEFPPFATRRFITTDLTVQVIEFSSRRVVDEIDISSLVKTGDSITSAWIPSSAQGDILYILIKHADGSVRLVSVNTNNQ